MAGRLGCERASTIKLTALRMVLEHQHLHRIRPRAHSMSTAPRWILHRLHSGMQIRARLAQPDPWNLIRHR